MRIASPHCAIPWLRQVGSKCFCPLEGGGGGTPDFKRRGWSNVPNCWALISLVVLYSQNYVGGIHWYYHALQIVLNTPQKSLLKLSHHKTIVAKFPPKIQQSKTIIPVTWNPECLLRLLYQWLPQSQSKLLGHFCVSLSAQCWCTRLGDWTAINNFERDKGSTRRKNTAFGLSVPTLFVWDCRLECFQGNGIVPSTEVQPLLFPAFCFPFA